jgi:predicted transcriptional regulator
MYKANLSSEMLNSYMKELLAKGFITEKMDKKDKRTYSLTEKGFNFLRDYKIIKGFVDSYDLKE